ncbi:MAG: hypothetical protein ABIJ26_02655 [Candidatus Margulisiibacteriota bacterium]|nr:hypothetical protein [Candidatus Margulisiibacteriota bacterium]
MIRRFIVLYLMLTLVLVSGSMAFISQDARVKFGELEKDEVWEGEVFLIGDVTVPEGRTLKILPGTKLVFDERDILESGKKKDQCELIVYGSVEAEANPNEPIKIVSLSGLKAGKIVDAKDVKVLRFKPYTVDTESLKQEFNSFKYSYNILWAAIYVMWVFVRNM